MSEALFGRRSPQALPIAVELARGYKGHPQLAARVAERPGDVLTVVTRIALVAWASLPRSADKSKPVERPAPSRSK